VKKLLNLEAEEIIAGKLFDLIEFNGTNDPNPVSFRNQLTAIYNFVRKEKFNNTLEVGLGIGGSAIHIMAATQKKHVAMDPVQLVSYNDLGLDNIRKFELESNLEFYNDCSEFVLPELLSRGRKFDFIYIDGDHKFDFALIDFYFSDLLLIPGGFMLLDDAWMLSVNRVLDFIQMNRKEYFLCQPIYNGGVLLRKEAEHQNSEVFRKF
jgi:predicted O-methyltransferase YrrM